MAGQRPPGSWGLESADIAVDDGTSCRAQTPPPGSTGLDDAWSGTTARDWSSAMLALGANASDGVGALQKTPVDFEGSQSWARLQPIALQLLGQQTLGLGAIYGIGENLVGSVVELTVLAKTLLLADLYDRAHDTGYGPVFTPFGRALAEVSMRLFDDHLREARDQREELIAELRYAVTHPGEVFGTVKAGYVAKWQQFERLLGNGTLSGRFQAGRIFGEVLLDIVSLIGGGAAVAKGLSNIPRLAKLGKMRIPVGGGGGGGAATTSTAARVAEVKSATGGAGPVRAGQAGEAAVRAKYDIGPRPNAIAMGTRKRIPDGLTDDVVSEVKNVKKLGYTQQLKDYQQFAHDTGREFRLYVRKGAQLSPALMREIAAGRIKLIPIELP